MIVGGFPIGNVTGSTWKARYEEFYLVERAPKEQRPNHDRLEISFGEVDREVVMYPHDYALVISIVITNCTTKRVLIDNRSLVDILFLDAFTKMGVKHGWLRPSPTPLKGFSGDAVQRISAIVLLVTVRFRAWTTTTMIDFLVVKAPSTYNVILGRPTLN